MHTCMYMHDMYMYVYVCMYMYVYVCMRVYVCIHVYVPVHVYVYVYIYVYVCICMYVYVYMYICMYVCMCVYVYVCMYACTYVCIVYVCICMYVCMYVCMYIRVCKGPVAPFVRPGHGHLDPWLRGEGALHCSIPGFSLHVFLMLFLFQDAFSGLFSNWFPVRISEHVRSSQPFLGPNLVPPRCPTLV